MSVPGIFPPVTLNGRPHIDGGVADNAPLARAADRGYRRALMIECACAAPCARPPTGLIGTIGRAFEIALARKHRAELLLEAGRIEILRIVPSLATEPGFLDLSAADGLIEAGRRQTIEELPDLLRCFHKHNGCNEGKDSGTQREYAVAEIETP